MPADVLRDQPPAFSDLATSAPSLDIAGELARTRQQIEAKQKEREASNAAVLEAMKKESEATKPALRDVEASMARREALAGQRPIQPETQPPPSPNLHDYFASPEGEPPQNTLMKLLTSIEVLASGFTGIARKNGTTAMASLQGMYKGINEGSRDKFDREFLTWKAATDRMIADHRTRIAEYNALMDDASLSVDQRMQLLKLKATEAGHDTAMSVFKANNAAEDLKFLSDYSKQLLTLQDHRDKLAQQREDKIRHDEYMMEMKRQTAEIAKQRQTEKQNAVLEQYPPEAIDALAWTAIKNEGRVPSLGMGAAGQVVRGRVLARVGALARENNIPLSQLPAIAAEMRGWQQNISTSGRQLAYWNANISTFHKHVEQFLELSDKVARGPSPVLNRVTLRGAKQYAGDPGVAALDAMANEVAQEYAKLSVGTAQGDQATRSEARDKIDAAMTPDQLRSIMKELVRAGENRKTSWEEAMKQGTENVSTFGGRITVPLPPGSKETAPADFVWDEKAGKLVPRGR